MVSNRELEERIERIENAMGIEQNVDGSSSTEQLAKTALNVGDMRQASSEQLGANEYLQREYSVDASNYGSTEALIDAKREA